MLLNAIAITHIPTLPPSTPRTLALLQEVSASNAAFVKMIGQPIPDTWRSGVHFHAVDVNVFSPGEVVVVSRSNGTKTFGVVEKTTSVRLHTARFCLGALPCLFGVR